MSNSKPFISPYSVTNGNTGVRLSNPSAVQNLSEGWIEVITKPTTQKNTINTLIKFDDESSADANHFSQFYIKDAASQFLIGYQVKSDSDVIDFTIEHGLAYSMLLDGESHELKVKILNAAESVIYYDGIPLGNKGAQPALTVSCDTATIGIANNLTNGFTGLISSVKVKNIALTELFSFSNGYNQIEDSDQLVEFIQNNSLKLSCNNNIEDLSDTNKTVTANSTPVYDLDRFGRENFALKFALSQYLTADAVGSNEITLISWFNSDTIASEQLIISHTISATDQFNLFLKSSRLNCEYYDGTSYTKGTDFNLVSNRWYLAIATVNKTTKDVKLFFLNREISTTGIAGTKNTLITNKALVGYNDVAGATNIFSGLMSYVEIRNYENSLIDNKADFKPVIKRDTVNFTTDGSVTINTASYFSVGKTYIAHGDGTASESMINTFDTTHSYVSGKNYEVWIDNAKNITLLLAESNALLDINVSNLINATQIRVQLNLLSKLDVTKNTLLQRLYASGNSISTIDLTFNTALFFILLQSNNLTNGVDFSTNIAVTTLDISSNSMTTTGSNLVLSSLITSSLSNNGTLIIRTGNDTLDATGEAHVLTLQTAGWTVT